MKYYSANEHYMFYYHKDYLDNIREVYSSCKETIVDFTELDKDDQPMVVDQYYTPLTCIQRMQYYPSGLPWKDCYRADEQTIKYNSKEFVEMHGLDEYDSKARWYYPAIMRTTTMDPLCEKYYDISPYAWCGNSPVNYVDPDGRRCTLSVNNRSNTINISAKYYASRNDSRYAMKAADFWNNQKELTYTTSDGKEYSVHFALKVYSSKNPEQDAGTDDNSFKIINALGFNADGNKITGETIANYQISIVDAYKEESTSAHEIGHTLMNISGRKYSEHSDVGIMTKSISSEGRSWSVPKEIVNTIVESNGFNQNITLWQIIKSWFE